MKLWIREMNYRNPEAGCRYRNILTIEISFLKSRAQLYTSGKLPKDLPSARVLITDSFGRFMAALPIAETEEPAFNRFVGYSVLLEQALRAYDTCMSLLENIADAQKSPVAENKPPMKIQPPQQLNSNSVILCPHDLVDMVLGVYKDNNEQLCGRCNNLYTSALALHAQWTAQPKTEDTRGGLAKLLKETREYIRSFLIRGHDVLNVHSIYLQYRNKLPDKAQVDWDSSTSLSTLEECLRFTQDRLKKLPTVQGK